MVLLIPEVLVTSSGDVTPSDNWCEEHRVNAFGLFRLFHGELLVALVKLDVSYLLGHSHPGADVSRNLGFVKIFDGW